jgi:RHS repeat-associated protein
MIAINKILLPGCTGEGCGGDIGIGMGNRYRHCNTHNRAPATRNYLRAVTLGRWLTRDPIGYQGGINLYGYVNSSPVGNVDAEGASVINPGEMVGPGPVMVTAAPGEWVLGAIEAPFKWIGNVVTAAAYWYYAGKMAQVNSAAQGNYYQKIYNGHIPQNVTAGSPEQMQNLVNGSHAAAKCATLPGTGGSGYGEPDIPTSPGDYGKSVGKEAVKRAMGEP